MTLLHEDLLEHISERKQTSHRKISVQTKTRPYHLLLLDTNHTAKPAIEKEYINAKLILISRLFHTPFSNYSFIPLYQV
jgi:hypothetical protein